MTSDLRPVVLVTRATSELGARVVRVLTRHGGFAMRAVTCAPGSDAARALAGDNVEVVRGDCDDFESLRHAMAGCYGVVAVASSTLQCTLDLLDAAADAGIGRVALVLEEADRDVAAATARTAAEYADAAGVPLVIVFAGGERSDPALEQVPAAFARPPGSIRR